MTGHAYRAGASARVLRFDCGRVCLDLAATAHPVERLDGPDRLRQWLAGAGLVPPGTPLERAGPGWLAAFRDLRTQIAAVVGAELDGRPPGHALDRVNAVARNPPPPPRAVRRADATLGRGLS
uniref:ABATE domain-containing protein n=1 Tax=Streptomyces albidoflavus TaxID=1886 RepID=UPI0040568272